MWDALVRVNRAADRAQTEAARTDPDIDAIATEIDRLSTEIADAVMARRAARSRARSRVDTPELDDLIASMSDARKASNKALWPLMREWRKANKDDVQAIEDLRKEKVQKIGMATRLKYAVDGSPTMYWGNSNRVLNAFDTARKLGFKTGDAPRTFDRTRTDGVLTVQIIGTGTGKGAAMSEIMGGAFNPLQIGPVDPRAFDPETPRGERSRLCHTWVDLHVDAAGHRIRLPLSLHRLPPESARVKSAQLTWRAEGERVKWQLALTCVGPAAPVAHPSPAACGIDVGWRLQPDGSLLVATLVDATGKPARYALPAYWMAGMDQVERLASHVDDGVLALAVDYHARQADLAGLPDDLRIPLVSWRPKLGARSVGVQALHDAVLARISAVKGTDARADVPADIRTWYDRYRHLAVWRDDLRAKLQRRRRELYRLMAKEIATGYAVIGIEDLDLSGMAKTKKRAPESGDNPLHDAARANRVRAAIYSFLLELRNQAGKRGAEVVKVVGPSTMWCPSGHKTAQRDRSNRVWKCEHPGCGAVWDQDVNAASNIYNAATGDASGPVVTLDTGSARNRRGKKKQGDADESSIAA